MAEEAIAGATIYNSNGIQIALTVLPLQTGQHLRNGTPSSKDIAIVARATMNDLIYDRVVRCYLTRLRPQKTTNDPVATSTTIHPPEKKTRR